MRRNEWPISSECLHLLPPLLVFGNRTYSRTAHALTKNAPLIGPHVWQQTAAREWRKSVSSPSFRSTHLLFRNLPLCCELCCEQILLFPNTANVHDQFLHYVLAKHWTVVRIFKNTEFKFPKISFDLVVNINNISSLPPHAGRDFYQA